MTETTSEKGFISAQVPASLAHQLRVAAALCNESRSELIRKALTEYLARLDCVPDFMQAANVATRIEEARGREKEDGSGD